MNKQEKIRTRITYKDFKNIATKLTKIGVPDKCLPKAVDVVYDTRDDKRAFRSNTAAVYAQQSIDLLKKDLKTKA
mgnify:CR=1 FL=1